MLPEVSTRIATCGSPVRSIDRIASLRKNRRHAQASSRNPASRPRPSGATRGASVRYTSHTNATKPTTSRARPQAGRGKLWEMDQSSPCPASGGRTPSRRSISGRNDIKQRRLPAIGNSPRRNRTPTTAPRPYYPTVWPRFASAPPENVFCFSPGTVAETGSLPAIQREPEALAPGGRPVRTGARRENMSQTTAPLPTRPPSTPAIPPSAGSSTAQSPCQRGRPCSCHGRSCTFR